MSGFVYDLGVYELKRGDVELEFPLRPNMDLHEDNEKNLVIATFEFPGVMKENIQIACHNGKLTVSAKRFEDDKPISYSVRERYHGKYTRTLQLPIGVRDQNITAAYDNGVLTITFPKSTPEQETTQIPIG